MSPPLCLSCGPIDDDEYRNSPALSRLREWQDKVALFWGENPWFFRLLRLPLLFFCLAILCAFYPETREYTCVFVVLSAGLMIAREYFPLAPVPFNVYNVVTSRKDTYSTAACMLPLTLLAILFVGVFVVISERAGNIAYHAQTDFMESPASYWGTEPLPWLSVFVILAPLMYFSSLTISNRFVGPRVEKLATSIPS